MGGKRCEHGIVPVTDARERVKGGHSAWCHINRVYSAWCNIGRVCGEDRKVADCTCGYDALKRASEGE